MLQQQRLTALPAGVNNNGKREKIPATLARVKTRK
jgi:hypothetical protein